jgi:CRP/FNR family cyclic AMP-dependent transcriptional regulator
MRIQCKPSTVRSLPFFSALTEEELAEVLKAVQHRTYPARATIVRAGDPADGLYFILSGRVHVSLSNGHGREVIVAILGPNHFFGATGLLEGGARTEDVHSHDACDVLFAPRRTLLDCVQRNPASAMFLLRELAARVADANAKIASLALLDVYSRVARVIVDNVRDVRGDMVVEPGSELIAAMVGASREMVSRVVKDMIGKGMVRRYKRKLIVLDRASLVRRAASVIEDRSEKVDTYVRPSPPAAQPFN